MTFISTVQALNPTAWYRCNDAVGSTTLADYSGNNHPGSITGTVYQQNGGFTGDGNTSIMTTTNGFLQAAAGLPGTTNSAFTVSMIIRPFNLSGSTFLMGFANASAGSGWMLGVTGNAVGFYLTVNNTTAGSNFNFSSVGSGLRGKPFLLTITYDGSGNWSVYGNSTSTPYMTVSQTLSVPGGGTLKFGNAFTNAGPNAYTPCQFQDIMFFNSVLSTTNIAAIYNAAAPNGFLNPQAMTIASNSINNVLNWTVANGGTSPYTYNVTRSLTSGPLPGGSSLTGTNVYSGTALTYTDVPPDSQPYFYHMTIVDATGSAIWNNEVYGVAYGYVATVVGIGAIGDSRTIGYNATLTPIDQMVQFLELSTGNLAQFRVNNQGVGGSSTVSWLSSILSTAISAFQSFASTLPSNSKFFVNFNLGVNDAQSTVRTNPAQYIANVANIISQLKAANIPHFSGVILQYTFPFILSGAGQTYDETAIGYIQQYNSMLLSLVDNTTVFMGDTQAFQYFTQNTNQFSDGLHLTNGGYTAWGELMASSSARSFGLSIVGGGSTYSVFNQPLRVIT
jgi:lysophospholipase L1-like esterase